MLKTAIRHAWLSHLPDLSPPYKTQGKIVHRPWFSPEYKQLYQATRDYVHSSKGKYYQWNAEQVHDFVLFSRTPACGLTKRKICNIVTLRS